MLENIQMVAADLNGDIQTINAGKDDDGTPIFFELETQELEFGNRAHLKNIADKITVFTEFGGESDLKAREEDRELKIVDIDLSKEVSIGKDIKLEGNYFSFLWSGNSSGNSPVFHGFALDNINDLGLTEG